MRYRGNIFTFILRWVVSSMDHVAGHLDLFSYRRFFFSAAERRGARLIACLPSACPYRIASFCFSHAIAPGASVEDACGYRQSQAPFLCACGYVAVPRTRTCLQATVTPASYPASTLV